MMNSKERRKSSIHFGNFQRFHFLDRSKESRKRINHPPPPQYSALGEKLRLRTPAALQCALFCGGSRCQYEQPHQATKTAIQGLFSDWITDDILAMARPSTASIAARNIIQQFHSWNIRTVINLQCAGEHASCGPPLTSSGFTYDPAVFMANDIYYYNFAWADYGEASLGGLLDMAKVLAFALQEGRVAVHCHAVFALKLWFEPWKGVCRCRGVLKGKVVLVTGGNTGIGLETARDLARRGARVIIASRNTEKSKRAVEDIIATTGNEEVEFKYLDLSSFESIRRFADEFNRNESVLDVLVNNAGCAALKRIATKDGIDLVMQINYLGPFLLTNLLLDKLIKSKPSRIVIVSSYAHYFAKLDADDLAGLKTKGYWTIYANSKLCNVLWAKALSKKLPAGVTANALHPGVVKTEIWNKLPAVCRTVIFWVIDLMFKNSAEGAQTTIHLAVANELCNSSGLFYADCRPVNPSAAANDVKLIETVWERSIQLTQSNVQIKL